MGSIDKRVNENFGSRRILIRIFLITGTFGKIVDCKGEKKKVKCLKAEKTVVPLTITETGNQNLMCGS